MTQSNEQEWEDRIRKGEDRFLVPTYVLKDRFNQPGTPFLVAAYYIDAPRFAELDIKQKFSTTEIAKVGE